MSSIDTWAAFFGWCTVVNLAIYVLSVFMLMLARGLVTRINCAVFGITEEDARREAFKYIAHFKLAITVFCFSLEAPMISLSSATTAQVIGEVSTSSIKGQ